MTTPLPNPENPEGHAHYMRPLDGIRGMACMIVIVSHIVTILHLKVEDSIYNFGSSGVAIFFTLSGFLMSVLYSDKNFSVDSSAKYMIARMSRIAPAYWIAITFAWILYMVLPDFGYKMHAFVMLRSVFFMSNVGVFWSIPPEIQFYGFFLLLWFAYGKFKTGNYWWMIGSAVLCTAFIATKEQWGGLMLPSKLHLFLGGFLAAFLLKSASIKRYLCSNIAQLGLSIAILLYFHFLLEHHKIYEDLIFGGLIALFIASFSQSSIISRIFETHMMRMMGAASFSIYLFHDVILQAMHLMGAFSSLETNVSIAIMCFVSVAIPVAFHYLVEKPLNMSSKKWLLEKFEAGKTWIATRKTSGT